MKLLLDTHVLLWWIDGRPLPRRVTDLLGYPENEGVVSLASAWEVAIKAGLGKLQIPSPQMQFLCEQMEINEFSWLGIGFEHLQSLVSIPNHLAIPLIV